MRWRLSLWTGYGDKTYRAWPPSEHLEPLNRASLLIRLCKAPQLCLHWPLYKWEKTQQDWNSWTFLRRVAWNTSPFRLPWRKGAYETIHRPKLSRISVFNPLCWRKSWKIQKCLQITDRPEGMDLEINVANGLQLRPKQQTINFEYSDPQYFHQFSFKGLFQWRI